ncbi:hypothetical protein [Actinomadura nitritigenes]|uniref:hypothetical protein n=1 Tax=Actinomadura nitritigenes TaxID=134602 RepID=UPI003D8BAD10
MIRRLFRIGYPRPGVSLLLRRNGWSVQVPGVARSSATTRPSGCGKSRCGRRWEPPRRTWAPGSASRTRPVRGSGRPKDVPGAAGDTAPR